MFTSDHIDDEITWYKIILEIHHAWPIFSPHEQAFYINIVNFNNFLFHSIKQLRILEVFPYLALNKWYVTSAILFFNLWLFQNTHALACSISQQSFFQPQEAWPGWHPKKKLPVKQSSEKQRYKKIRCQNRKYHKSSLSG